jgi:hypothetical protein
VKELTRLRMLMSEREAFFGGTDGRTEPAGARPEGILSVPSSDSYESFDYHQGGLTLDAASPHFGPAAAALSVQKPPLFAPPSQQAFEVSSRPVAPQQQAAYGKAGSLSHSASLGGLGVRGTNVGGLSNAAPSPVGSVHSYGSAANSPYLPQQGLMGSTVRPGLYGNPATASVSMGPSPSTSSLSLNGSAVMATRRPSQSDRSLAPLSSQASPASLYGSPYQSLERGDLDAGLAREPPRANRGIERDLMLSSQIPHGHGLAGGIDRVERSLNGHAAPQQYSHASTLHAHGLFDGDLLRGQDPYARSYMLNHQGQHDPFAPSRAGGNFGSAFGLQGDSHRSDLSLNSLLEPSPLRGGQGAGSQAHSQAGRGDMLFDVLSRDHSGQSSGNQSARLSAGSAPGLGPLHTSDHQVAPHSRKILLDPLAAHTVSAHSPTPALNLPRRDSPSPVQLAPLTPSPEKVTPGSAHTTVRKLSGMPKAATYNALDTRKVGESHRDLSEMAPLSPTSSSRKDEPATSPLRVEAFGEAPSSSLRLNGIASPSVDEADDALANLAPSPQSRRFPMMKANTTSRLPIDTTSSALSPKLLIMKNKMAGHSNEITPPPTSGLERHGTSDSGGMNFLASEMAEMVLDTPSQLSRAASSLQPHATSTHYFPWDDRDYSGHLDDELLSRDNSTDLSRILGAMGGLGDESGSHSGHFKRANSTSLSFNE